MDKDAALQITRSFDPGSDGLALKSRNLLIQLLTYSEKPFSRNQFAPGHVTCTALILHPDRARVLTMHHHRLHRWLLPGGHIEKSDASLAETAAREAFEETGVALDRKGGPFLAGIDVHGIPPKRDEPFHLHHDLIWCFQASSDRIEKTLEAPQVRWTSAADWDQLALADSIRNSIQRVVEYLK